MGCLTLTKNCIPQSPKLSSAPTKVAFFQVPSTLHSSHLDSKSLLPHPGHLFPLRCPEKFTQGELRMLASSASPPTTLLTKKQGVGRSHPPCPSPRPCWTCLASEPADQACPARSRPQNFSGCATLPSPAIRCMLHGFSYQEGKDSIQIRQTSWKCKRSQN